MQTLELPFHTTHSHKSPSTRRSSDFLPQNWRNSLPAGVLLGGPLVRIA